MNVHPLNRLTKGNLLFGGFVRTKVGGSPDE